VFLGHQVMLHVRGMTGIDDYEDAQPVGHQGHPRAGDQECRKAPATDVIEEGREHSHRERHHEIALAAAAFDDLESALRDRHRVFTNDRRDASQAQRRLGGKDAEPLQHRQP